MDPDVLGYLKLVGDHSADPEPNLRATFLDPMLKDLGYPGHAEGHLEAGKIDYLYDLGDCHVGIEAKPPGLTFPKGVAAPTYHDRLAKDFQQVREYFADPRLRFIVLTDGVTFYFYSRASLRSPPHYFARRRADDLVGTKDSGPIDDLARPRVLETLQRWEGEA